MYCARLEACDYTNVVLMTWCEGRPGYVIVHSGDFDCVGMHSNSPLKIYNPGVIQDFSLGVGNTAVLSHTHF